LIYNFFLNELQDFLGSEIDKYINSKYAAQLYIITLPKAHSIEKVTTFKKLAEEISKSRGLIKFE